MTEADYSFGNPDEGRPGPDNRSDYRLTATARVVLELESKAPDASGGERARDLACRLRDISARGMSLFSREPLSIGALLPAQVSLGHRSESFTLMVEVVWCRPSQSQFLVGCQVLDSAGTAYVEWVEAVAQALAAE